MNKHVFVTREIPDIAIAMLEKSGCQIDIYKGQGIPSQRDLIRSLRAHHYEALLSLLTDKIDASVLDAAPFLGIISNYAVGFDNIDIAEAKRRHIAVTNTPGDYVDVVAEHAVALVFALARRIIEADRYVRMGHYEGWSPMIFMGTEVSGKTIGIVGAGRIGARFARHMYRGFDAKIIYYDVVRNSEIENGCKAEFVPDLDDLLAQADVVSLHVPLMDSTHHLIDARRLSLMKPTAYLVNTSRGPIVDEHALVGVLRAGRIRGAGLDVFEKEPRLAAGLARLPNVVLTPHIASATELSRNHMAAIAAQNIIDFFHGKKLKNCVNL